ncbi:MAG: hypothetical protein AAF587_45020, partial [Bacteroidota bacterium]
ATRFSSPHFPSQNPAETFMKTVGKAMKINQRSKNDEARILQETLKTYRQTPHPATGIPPANMIFRDGLKDKFPRKTLSEDDISKARALDKEKKDQHEGAINASKYRKESDILQGDLVLVRDSARRSKFDPIFLPSPYQVQEVNTEMKNVLIRDLYSPRTFLRHLDDVKKFQYFIDTSTQQEGEKYKMIRNNLELEEAAKQLLEEEHQGETVFCEEPPLQTPPQSSPQIVSQPLPPNDDLAQSGVRTSIPQRVSTRVRKARKRYIEIC